MVCVIYLLDIDIEIILNTCIRILNHSSDLIFPATALRLDNSKLQ